VQVGQQGENREAAQATLTKVENNKGFGEQDYQGDNCNAENKTGVRLTNSYV